MRPSSVASVPWVVTPAGPGVDSEADAGEASCAGCRSALDTSVLELGLSSSADCWWRAEASDSPRAPGSALVLAVAASGTFSSAGLLMMSAADVWMHRAPLNLWFV